MHTKRIVLSLLAALLCGVLPARTVQAVGAGGLDTTFNANTDGTVYAVVVQSDGKIVIGGSFANVDGVAQANLARLNVDGSLDTTFTATTDGGIQVMAAQPDGKLLIGGSFNVVSGTTASLLARLNTDGSVDTTFGGSGAGGTSNSGVDGLVCQSDGKILVAGYCAEYFGYGGTYSIFYSLQRLNTDGSVDASFDPPESTPLPFGAVAVQSDDKILLGHSTDPISPAVLTRLNADGSADNTFMPTDAVAYEILYDIVVQPNGQIVACGPLQNSDSSAVFRMNTDGSLDTTFQVAMCTGSVDEILYQPDGQLVVGGGFTQVNGSDRQDLARLAADGTLDSGFVPPTSTDGNVQAMALQADGHLVVGGNFTHIDSTLHRGITRLYGAAEAVPQITSAASATGQIGMPFSYQITADNSPTAFAAGAAYNINVGLDKPLPAGLSLDTASGVISGMPTREGDYVIAIEASNTVGASLKEITLTIATAGGQTHPTFFTGEEPLTNGVYYLKFFYSGSQSTNFFSYYSYLSDPHYIYHFDLGYEYVFDAADGNNGVYLYDFASSDFFYTSPTFPFPYLYDFSLDSVVYYYGNPNDPERYDTNGVRYFYNFATGKIITK